MTQLDPAPTTAWNWRKSLAAALIVLVGGGLVAVGSATAEDTDTAWPGVAVLVGVALVIGGGWLLVPRRWTVSTTAPVDPQAPGWYPDPESPSMRFWDGAAWTDQRAPLPPKYSGPTTLQIGLAVAGGIALFVFLFGRG